jgi:hypothetical protein
LKKSRDSQRISDLSTIKTAIGLYMTSVSPAYLGGATDNNFCEATPGVIPNGTTKISYSLPATSVPTTITDTTLDNSTLASFRQLGTASAASLTNGTGWVPVNFSLIPGGSPISNIPLDPLNTISDIAVVRATDLVYRYACSITPLAYEIDAQLESEAYTVTDNKRASDGGNSTLYYETGTNLLILGAGGSVTLDF